MSSPIDLVRAFSRMPVAVVGDVMLDHFLIGHVDRISPEAPVPVVRLMREEYRLGGAANVAHDLAVLGSQAMLIGVIGDDEAAISLRTAMRVARLDDSQLATDPSRPTTSKMRVVTTRNQQVARVDREEETEVTGHALAAIVSRIEQTAPTVRAIVLSDYRKGVISLPVIEAATRTARDRGLHLLVDPKVPQANRYRGATLITPNHHEAELMTQTSIRTPDDARAAARMLHERTDANVLITWGEHGMWVLDGSGRALVEQALPAVAREVADVTGAGDTVIAVLALALSAGASLVEAARLANAAAGLVVARFGPSCVTPDELVDAVSHSRA